MKSLARLSLIFILLTTITSCLGGANTPENLDVEKDFKLFESKKFSIKVPDYLTETDDLNEDAEMQMQNMFRETYMFVMAESKADYDFARRILDMGNDSLSYTENYMDMQLESMEEAFDFTITKEKTVHEINDMPALTVEMRSSIEGFDVVYVLTTVETEHDILYATAWTLEDRKEKYFPSFYKSIETLQQLEYDLDSEESELDIDFDEIFENLDVEE